MRNLDLQWVNSMNYGGRRFPNTATVRFLDFHFLNGRRGCIKLSLRVGSPLICDGYVPLTEKVAKTHRGNFRLQKNL